MPLLRQLCYITCVFRTWRHDARTPDCVHRSSHQAQIYSQVLTRAGMLQAHRGSGECAVLQVNRRYCRLSTAHLFLLVREDKPHNSRHEFACSAAGWALWQIMRRIGFTVFGVVGTEANTAFLDQAVAAVPDPAKVPIAIRGPGRALVGMADEPAECPAHAPGVLAEAVDACDCSLLRGAAQGAVLVCNLGGNLDSDYGPSPYGYQTRCAGPHVPFHRRSSGACILGRTMNCYTRLDIHH